MYRHERTCIRSYIVHLPAWFVLCGAFVVGAHPCERISGVCHDDVVAMQSKTCTLRIAFRLFHVGMFFLARMRFFARINELMPLAVNVGSLVDIVPGSHIA